MSQWLSNLGQGLKVAEQMLNAVDKTVMRTVETLAPGSGVLLDCLSSERSMDHFDAVLL